jgi:hypothetical protein
MHRLLTALALGAALLLAPEALAQCNTSGTAAGCSAANPFSCAASPTCYGSYAGCTADSRCGTSGTGGGTGSTTACNTSGTATGCNANNPFSCTASTTCYATYAVCSATSPCTASSGTGGGTGSTGGTCNTTGTATGCNANNPFSCTASSTCHSMLSGCTSDPLCPGGGKTPAGGCTTALGWSPVLGLLLFLPWRRRPARA